MLKPGELTEWDEHMQHLEEDYEMGRGDWAPREVLFEETLEDRERRERHHDFIYRIPRRVSDDWRMAA